MFNPIMEIDSIDKDDEEYFQPHFASVEIDMDELQDLESVHPMIPIKLLSARGIEFSC